MFHFLLDAVVLPLISWMQLVDAKLILVFICFTLGLVARLLPFLFLSGTRDREGEEKNKVVICFYTSRKMSDWGFVLHFIRHKLPIWEHISLFLIKKSWSIWAFNCWFKERDKWLLVFSCRILLECEASHWISLFMVWFISRRARVALLGVWDRQL